jgi:disease resistance protein RPM1
MEFATGALGTLLPNLVNMLHGEYRLHKRVRKNIEFLTKELETSQAALRSVGEVPQEQLYELVKIWAQDARELSYDMEDVVDTFLVRVKGPDPS